MRVPYGFRMLGVGGGKGFVWVLCVWRLFYENREGHYSMTGHTVRTINIIRFAVGNCVYRRTERLWRNSRGNVMQGLMYL
jgi:hypothetical protein